MSARPGLIRCRLVRIGGLFHTGHMAHTWVCIDQNEIGPEMSQGDVLEPTR